MVKEASIQSHSSECVRRTSIQVNVELKLWRGIVGEKSCQNLRVSAIFISIENGKGKLTYFLSSPHQEVPKAAC